MNCVEQAINILKNQRSIFHSEDDFKLSLAITLKEIYPEFNIRLERPVEIEMIHRSDEKSKVRAPIDIVIIDKNGNTIPIELKYKTKKAHISFNNEEYKLTAQGANDIGRNSFRKDIYRIEKYKNIHPNCNVGYVLILTNDEKYFDKNVFESNTLDKHFSFHDGVEIKKNDEGWYYEKVNEDKYNSKNHWTFKKELSYKLDLLNDYKINWKEYSKIENMQFKFCLIEVI
jgi:hypothetical protein